MKTLLTLFVLFFSSSVFAESVEDRLDKLEERINKIENFLKIDGYAQFKSIVGQWINAEDSGGEFLWVNFDGQACVKDNIDDRCDDWNLKAIGKNRFVFIEDDEGEYYLEVDGDLIFVKSSDGKKIYMTMKRY